jgi:hypothetical protein
MQGMRCFEDDDALQPYLESIDISRLVDWSSYFFLISIVKIARNIAIVLYIHRSYIWFKALKRTKTNGTGKNLGGRFWPRFSI